MEPAPNLLADREPQPEPTLRSSRVPNILAATALVLAGGTYLPHASSSTEVNQAHRQAAEAHAAEFDEPIATATVAPESLLIDKQQRQQVSVSSGPTPNLVPSETATPTPEPSPTPTQEATTSPEVLPLTSEVLKGFGIAGVFTMPKYGVSGPIEVSNFGKGKPNSVGLYNDPPLKTAEIGLNLDESAQRNGTTWSPYTLHTTKDGKADMAVTMLDNKFDKQTYGGWSLGDSIVLRGYENNSDAWVRYEIVPMPDTSVSAPVEASPAVKFSKDLGKEVSNDTATSQFFAELDSYVKKELANGAVGFIEVGSSCVFEGEDRINGHRPNTCAVLARAVEASDGAAIYEYQD